MRLLPMQSLRIKVAWFGHRIILYTKVTCRFQFVNRGFQVLSHVSGLLIIMSIIIIELFL